MHKAAVLAQLKQAGTDSRRRDRICVQVAEALIAAGTEPDFRVVSDDFTDDVFLICADRYWQRRLIEHPDVITAAACARWLEAHVDAAARPWVEHRWALGNGFVTRDSVETAGELAEGTATLLADANTTETVALFAVLYHAGKLRSNRAFDALRRFLDSSALLEAAGARRDDAAIVALQALAAFGSRAMTTQYAIELLERAWNTPDRTPAVTDLCVQAIADSVPFEEQGSLLAEYASQAVAEAPDNGMFYFRLASGLHLCGRQDEALEAIDEAITLLPAVGGRSSHGLLQEQHLNKREAILEGRLRAQWSAEQQRRWEQQEQANAVIHDTLQSSTVRAVELVAIFTAAIAFSVGSLQVTLSGNLHLSDRVWLIVALGVGLAVFALLTIGGTWIITGRRQRPGPPS